eukprot:TRINITY_DN44406_c0_g1_i1.p1 TRINITY_DN44406_c0_g1~~TRINITY_DN44406_c0_g1_i1.p1  ORF type:complete len:391 (-),score=56.98 TRINITY_DN44406_c0_g1_i1:409-1581(-)
MVSQPWRHDNGLGEALSEAMKFLAPDSVARETVVQHADAQVGSAIERGLTPHFILDHVFPPRLVRAVASEVPEMGEDSNGCLPGNYICFSSSGSNSRRESRKNMLNKEHQMGPATLTLMGLLRSATWISLLERSLGVPGLIPDPFMGGAGVHVTTTGGHLDLHADGNFEWNTNSFLFRRVNTFVYLNEGWEDFYGGHLELWDENLTACQAAILPTFGRVVSFRVTDYTYHGHPSPLTPPPGRARRSLAMYYYTTYRPKDECIDGNCFSFRTTRWGEPNCEDGCSFCRPTAHLAVDGCPRTGVLKKPKPMSRTELAHVRCCSLDGTDCLSKHSACRARGTFEDAEELCKSLGRRLCSQAELESNLCCGTGCGMDNELVWTSMPVSSKASVP